jgi:hypothetical protein
MTMKRIVGPTQLSNSAATLYTAPTGIRAVIKRIHIVNPTTTAYAFTLSIGADGAGTELYKTQSIAANGGYFDDYANYTLEPADILQGYAGTASKLTITVNADLTCT